MLERIWKWFWGFWWRCWQWAIGKQGEMATMISIVFAILATLGITGTIISFAQQNAHWLFMLLPLGVWFFLVAPVVVWKKEREKVLAYEKFDLELIVENGAQYIHRRGKHWIFRIGIKTNGRKSIHNVEVAVAERNGKEHAYSDAPLRPAYSLPGDSGAFTVKPDDIQFVEVCSWNNGSKEMRMHYHTSYQIILKYYDEKYDNDYHLPPQMLPFVLFSGIPIEETITLCTTGDNVQSVSKTLHIDTSSKEPKWVEVDRGGQKIKPG